MNKSQDQKNSDQNAAYQSLLEQNEALKKLIEDIRYSLKNPLLLPDYEVRESIHMLIEANKEKLK